MSISRGHFAVALIVSAFVGFIMGHDPKQWHVDDFLLFQLYCLMMALSMPVGAYLLYGSLLWPKKKDKP